MSECVTVRVADPEKAIEEGCDRAPGATRAQLFKLAAVGGGSLLASGVAFGGIPSLAFGASASEDVKILNFALLLEYLEATFYTEAEQKHKLTGQTRGFAKIVGGHERTHVAYLKKALGSKAIKSPKFDFGDTTTNMKKFMATSIALEGTGVGAYNGQGPNLTKKTLAAAAEIVSVEARHAAWIRAIAGVLPAPYAFDPLYSKSKVLKIVGATGFVK